MRIEKGWVDENSHKDHPPFLNPFVYVRIKPFKVRLARGLTRPSVGIGRLLGGRKTFLFTILGITDPCVLFKI